MDPQPDARDDFRARLREAGGPELLALLRERADDLDVEAVRQVVRNPYADHEVMEALAGVQRLLEVYEVRRALAFHPRAPEALALRFVAGLFWRDLLELGSDVKVRPPLRVAADRYLAERLPSLAEGEKMSIARRAGANVLARLRHDPSRRVIAALLENPRLTEATLYPLVRREATPGPVLALIAESTRWGMRYELRTGLAANPSTPIEIALRLLPGLKRGDLAAIAAAERVAGSVRGRARALAGGGN